VKRVRATLGTVLFFTVAPAVVAGVVPRWISRWRLEEPFPYYAPVRVVGGLLLAVAVGFLVHAFVRFVTEGIGTPAPVAPTEHLVIGGVYRYIRNPMYAAVVGAIIGQALLLGQPALLLYAAFIGLVQAAFVRFHEEPALLRRYGSEYEMYRSEVPGWWPRRHPWDGAGDSSRSTS
jgi:protein-S-isoprenylcysteine O-methyltransferase Ste14